MKHITNTPRNGLRSPLVLGLLAAASAAALFAAAQPLVAQSAGSTLNSGGYATTGVPIGVGAQTAIQPVGVGPAAQSGPARPVPGQTTTAVRGRWTTSVTPFVETSATYSDNINLAPEGFEEDETVLTATGGVALSVQSSRLSGSLAYAASYDTYLNETNEDGFRHNLDTTWGAAVIPNLLYLDAAGGVAETYVDSTDRFSGNRVAGADNRSRAYYGSVSPSLRRNLGGWANAEARYILRGETYDDDNLGGNYSHLYRASLASDPRKFQRVGWAVASEYEDFRLEEDDGADRTRWSSQVSLAVPVSRAVALTGTAGYDQYGDIARDTELDGVWGNVGVQYTPTQRLTVGAYAGYRYNGFDYGAQVAYLLPGKTTAGLSAGRSVQFTDARTAPIEILDAGVNTNGQQQFYTPGGGLTTNVGQALGKNLLTGEFGVIGDPRFAVQRDEAIVDSVTASLTGQAGHTAYAVSATGLHRDYGGVFENETVLSGSLNVAHDITSRLAADAGIGYSRVDLEDSTNLDFDTLAAGVGLSYQLTEIVNVFGRYTYTQRFADDALDEFKENAGVVGVRASF